MASNVVTTAPDDEDDRRRPTPPRPKSPTDKNKSGGFFTIYKSGQGYWTRMGTVGGALLIGILSANFLYTQVPVWLNSAGVPAPRVRSTTLAICAIYFVAYALLCFFLINTARNADFLIATDSEMKKVNWTSRKELFGSTRIVIIFMLIIALFLFGFDVIFGYFFHLIGVLQAGPFGE